MSTHVLSVRPLVQGRRALLCKTSRHARDARVRKLPVRLTRAAAGLLQLLRRRVLQLSEERLPVKARARLSRMALGSAQLPRRRERAQTATERRTTCGRRKPERSQAQPDRPQGATASRRLAPWQTTPPRKAP